MAKNKAHEFRVGLLWGTAVATVITLFAYSSLSRIGVVALCIVGSLGFILACADHGWLWKAPHPLGRPIRAIIVIAAIIGTMAGIGWIVYPPIRRHTLGHEERETFKQSLQGKGGVPLEMQVACPLNDEKT